MFSGQGSQYYHMGMELFKKHPVFRNWMQTLDATAYVICGHSILDYLYDEDKKKSDSFNQTIYTHPAIFMVEFALAKIFLERGIKPDYVLGTSIGEFATAAVTHVMSFEEAMLALIRQAEVLETHCEKGGMLAILHDPTIYDDMPFLYENSEVLINQHADIKQKAEFAFIQHNLEHFASANLDYQLAAVYVLGKRGWIKKLHKYINLPVIEIVPFDAVDEKLWLACGLALRGFDD